MSHKKSIDDISFDDFMYVYTLVHDRATLIHGLLESVIVEGKGIYDDDKFEIPKGVYVIFPGFHHARQIENETNIAELVTTIINPNLQH